MGIKYICDGCEKELAGPEEDYASKQFNRADDDLNVRFEVGAKSDEGDNPKVLCKACAAGKVKTIIDAVSKETYTTEVKPE